MKDLRCITQVCGCHSHNGFLTSKGLKEAAQRERERNGLAAMGIVPYLDKVGSVRAVPETRDLYAFVTEDMTTEQEARFLNGS